MRILLLTAVALAAVASPSYGLSASIENVHSLVTNARNAGRCMGLMEALDYHEKIGNKKIAGGIAEFMQGEAQRMGLSITQYMVACSKENESYDVTLEIFGDALE